MRNKNNIYITEYDLERLYELLNTIGEVKSRDNSPVEQLKKEMERAKTVSSENISRNVVTMNSRVILRDMVTLEEFPCQIVFPADADLDADKISVLAPVGTALLGYKAGDTVSWKVPSGIRKLKIKEMLYQPESEGDLC